MNNKITKIGLKKKGITKKQRAIYAKMTKRRVLKTPKQIYSSLINQLERSEYNDNKGFGNNDTTPTKQKTYGKRKY